MKKLRYSDFVLTTNPGGSLYLSYSFGEFEICLEDCLGGFDVAIYRVGPDDRIVGLVEPKKCTDFNFGKFGINGLLNGQANMLRLRAEKFANEFYKKYNK